jgi:hypothetical protein
MTDERTIDLTPTPEGLRHSIALFNEQITKSEALIERVEDLQENRLDGMNYRENADDMAVIELALDALLDQEHARIGHMNDSINAAGG